MMNGKSTALALLFGTALIAGAAQAETVSLSAKLDGPTEVPAVTTNATGSADFKLDTGTKSLSYTVVYSGLSGPATAAHIHGPAAHGANAGVVVPLTKSDSPMQGQVTLNDAQIADLLAGKDYVNVHTAAHPMGEIRGYINK